MKYKRPSLKEFKSTTPESILKNFKSDQEILDFLNEQDDYDDRREERRRNRYKNKRRGRDINHRG